MKTRKQINRPFVWAAMLNSPYRKGNPYGVGTQRSIGIPSAVTKVHERSGLRRKSEINDASQKQAVGGII